MKLEIEITEEEIIAAITARIQKEISDFNESYTADEYINKKIRSEWIAAVDRHIAEVLGDPSKIGARIDAEIDRRVKARLNAVIKNT